MLQKTLPQFVTEGRPRPKVTIMTRATVADDLGPFFTKKYAVEFSHTRATFQRQFGPIFYQKVCS